MLIFNMMDKPGFVAFEQQICRYNAVEHTAKNFKDAALFMVVIFFHF